jgi:hypothetical protein
MKSSLLDPSDDDALSELYIANILSHNFLALFVKYVISALGCNPNTSGLLITGSFPMKFKNPS